MSKNWISERRMKSSGSINNTGRNGAQNGPLRKIVYILSHGNGMFDRDLVEMECGHTGRATIGAIRSRCKKCKTLQSK